MALDQSKLCLTNQSGFDPNDHHMKPPKKPSIIHLLPEHLLKKLLKEKFEPNHPITNLVVSLSQ
jgi:hypothetical protein